MKMTEFIPYEVAKIAYQYGYKKITQAYYVEGSDKLFRTWDSDNYKYTEFDSVGFIYPAPIHQELIDWILEKYQMYVYAQATFETPMRFEGYIKWQTEPFEKMDGTMSDTGIYLHGHVGEQNGKLYHSFRANSPKEALNEAFKLAFKQIKYNEVRSKRADL